jgi:GNAT superfamily N-acetyltransferase
MSNFERRRDQYVVSTDPRAVDVDVMHACLTRSYWAEGISKDVVQKSIPGSLCFSLLDGARMVGFARVVTDRATFAYLCDVFVLEEYRGRGLGTWLIESVVLHPDLAGLRRFVLATRDAHGLYERFDFAPLAKPEIFMEINRPDIYTAAQGPVP